MIALPAALATAACTKGSLRSALCNSRAMSHGRPEGPESALAAPAIWASLSALPCSEASISDAAKVAVFAGAGVLCAMAGAAGVWIGVGLAAVGLASVGLAVAGGV